MSNRTIAGRHFARWILGLLFIALTAAATGCAAQENGYTLFHKNQYAKAQRLLKPMSANNHHKDFALHELFYASACVEGGNYRDGMPALRNASVAMEAAGGGGDTEAVVGSEYQKVYRGDPYEKVMAHLYTGLLYFRDGKYERSLAAFRRSLLADQGTRTKDPDKKKDFVAGHYFAALAYDRLGEADNTEVHLRWARKFAGDSPVFTSSRLSEANVILLIAVGQGPIKTASGPGGSIVKMRPMPCPVTKVDVTWDAADADAAVFADDLYEEALAHGWGEMDKIRLGKGIAKEVLSRIPYVSLVSSFVRSEADLRVWSFLPGRLFLWAGQVKPGLHRMKLSCRDAKGNPVPEYEQVWFYLPVASDRPTTMYFRAVAHRQSIYEKVVVPLRADPPAVKGE